MKYDILPVSMERRVTLCGTNVYPEPELHPDRIMPEHDLLYIYHGEQKVGQDDTVYTLRSGDLMFLRAGRHHYGPERCSVNLRSMFIHMNRLPEDRSAVELTAAEAKGFASGTRLCLPTVIHCGQDDTISSLFRSIIDTYWTPREDGERSRTLMLNTLLNELCYLAVSVQQPEEEWSVDLIRLFHEHPDKTYSLAELVERTGMPERTLSAKFQTVTGKTVHQYQMDLKLDEAYRALRDGAGAVKTVSERYGFCDPYYFSRMFKRKFGFPPKQIKGTMPGANINRPPVK